MKHLPTFLLVGLLICSPAASALCVTTIPGGAIVDETWTLANSPYCIEGDLWVPNGSTLTIEPGVWVQFMGDYELLVFGTGVLHAVGTQANPILFREDSSNPDGWQGLVFDNATTGSQLIHCTIQDAVDTGLTIINSLPILEHCAFSNNTGIDGGGLFVELSTVTGTLTLKECLVNGNYAANYGGGMYASSSSAGMVLEGCRFNNNGTNPSQQHGDYHGGGIYFQSAAGGVFFGKGQSGCEIRGNEAYSKTISWNGSVYSYGGGIFIENGDLTLESCRISDNIATAVDAAIGGNEHSYGRGGGIYIDAGTALLINSILSSNSPAATGSNPSNLGGGIYINFGSVRVLNSDLVYNGEQGTYNSSGSFEAENSIVYFNSSEAIAGNATVAYSDIEGGWPTGSGNIDEDPEFVNPPNDYHLLPSSPAIDAGNSSAAGLPPTDLDGRSRISGLSVDMGPYEFHLPIFADDFESGDTSAWSGSVP